jgi:NAD(P)-dependent dehydrogenase (short-subunit alcohol dehydrogenase family)
MEKLDGRVAVVTGGASGIGRAMVDRFVQEGMKVVVADIEKAALDQAVRELRDGGAEVVGIPTDVANLESVTALANAARDRFGAAHVVCNNAGVSGHMGRSWLTPLEDWQWVLGVNVYGVIHGIQAFLPLLVEQNEGHVVNTGSGASFTALPGMAPYGASKHAVLAITRALRHELENMGCRVGASVLIPPLVRTRIMSSDRNYGASQTDAQAPPDDGTETLRKMLTDGIETGVPPEVMADAVIDGIRGNDFIIASHRENVVAAAETNLRMARGEWTAWP